MAIDGNKCHVDELEIKRLPMSPENPVSNAFTRTVTRLTTESDAQRVAANDKGRIWRIASSEATNRLGHPTAYAHFPEGQPLLLAADESSIRKRAMYATKNLWVTQYARDEFWAASYTPNQSPGFAGLPSYIKTNRAVDDEDIVVWHSFDLTHFPRTEDWPMMPMDYAGFKLKPEGFFGRNQRSMCPRTRTGRSTRVAAVHRKCASNNSHTFINAHNKIVTLSEISKLVVDSVGRRLFTLLWWKMSGQRASIKRAASSATSRGTRPWTGSRAPTATAAVKINTRVMRREQIDILR